MAPISNLFHIIITTTNTYVSRIRLQKGDNRLAINLWPLLLGESQRTFEVPCITKTLFDCKRSSSVSELSL